MTGSEILYVLSIVLIVQVIFLGLFINIAVGLRMNDDKQEHDEYLNAVPTDNRHVLKGREIVSDVELMK